MGSIVMNLCCNKLSRINNWAVMCKTAIGKLCNSYLIVCGVVWLQERVLA